MRKIRCKYNFHFLLTRFMSISKETEIISPKIGRNIPVNSIQEAVAVYVKSCTFFALLSKNLPAVRDYVLYKNRCTNYIGTYLLNILFEGSYFIHFTKCQRRNQILYYSEIENCLRILKKTPPLAYYSY